MVVRKMVLVLVGLGPASHGIASVVRIVVYWFNVQ